jgi:hypothetical protein
LPSANCLRQFADSGQTDFAMNARYPLRGYRAFVAVS